MSQLIIPAWLPADPRNRRWAAIALLVSVVGLVVAAVVAPALLLHRHYDDSIAKLSRQVSTQTSFNAMRPRLTEKLALLKTRDIKKLFLKGTSTALALAELQEMVRATIDANGGRVMNTSSVQVGALKEDGPHRQVAATFTMNATNTNLRRVLYAIETREPYLFIDSVVIQPQISSAFRPGPGAAEPEMFVQLDVRAYASQARSELATTATPQAGAGVASGSGAIKAISAEFPTARKEGAM